MADDGKKTKKPGVEVFGALTECVGVLDKAAEGDLDARVGDPVLGAGDEIIAKLGGRINKILDTQKSNTSQIDEFHASSMELAMGLSECFTVLEEVRKGNMEIRVGQETLASSEDLIASLGRLLNETIIDVGDSMETIRRQQAAITELSTPILQIWDGVLVLPVIGVVDTRRSADIMERLLGAIVARQSRFIILDITGVDLVDTRTADHFIKVMKASELLGAKPMLTGIRPAVAQTLVDLGVDLRTIKTLSTLQEGLRECIRHMDTERRYARFDPGMMGIEDPYGDDEAA